MRTKDFQRRSLAPRHRPVVRALAETLFAREEDAVGLAEARLDAFVTDVDHFLAQAGWPVRYALLFMIDGMRWLPLLLVGRFSTFEDLGLRDRTRMLTKMETSRIAALLLPFVAMKTLLTLTFYEDEQELVAAGYPGPARERYKRLLT